MNNPTQPDRALVAAWMESMEYRKSEDGYYTDRDKGMYIEAEQATFFYQAHVTAVAEGRREAVETIQQKLMSAPKDSWYGTLHETVAQLTPPKQEGME